MKVIPLVLVLVVTSVAADQVTFRGVYIGEPISNIVACSSGKAKAQKGYRVRGNICDGQHGYIFHTQVKGILNPKESGEWFESEGGKVIRIRIFVPNEDWDKIRYDLTQKLGSPSSEVPAVYQNGFGARWEFNQGFWIKEDLVAYAGIKVLPVRRVFGSGPATDGIEINITDTQHAKLPSSRPSTLD